MKKVLATIMSFILIIAMSVVVGATEIRPYAEQDSFSETEYYGNMSRYTITGDIEYRGSSYSIYNVKVVGVGYVVVDNWSIVEKTSSYFVINVRGNYLGQNINNFHTFHV